MTPTTTHPTETETDSEKPLTAVEATELDDLEQIIEKGVKTFIDVGKALQRINDGRLYRETHGTFEAYLRERWGMSRSYAYRQIDAAAVTGTVSPMGDTEAMLPIGDTPEPASERVARELTPLKGNPQEMREAWRETVEQHGEKPTAKQTRNTVRKRTQQQPSDADAELARVTEKFGQPVPDTTTMLQGVQQAPERPSEPPTQPIPPRACLDPQAARKWDAAIARHTHIRTCITDASNPQHSQQSAINALDVASRTARTLAIDLEQLATSLRRLHAAEERAVRKARPTAWSG